MLHAVSGGFSSGQALAGCLQLDFDWIVGLVRAGYVARSH